MTFSEDVCACDFCMCSWYFQLAQTLHSVVRNEEIKWVACLLCSTCLVFGSWSSYFQTLRSRNQWISFKELKVFCYRIPQTGGFHCFVLFVFHLFLLILIFCHLNSSGQICAALLTCEIARTLSCWNEPLRVPVWKKREKGTPCPCSVICSPCKVSARLFFMCIHTHLDC